MMKILAAVVFALLGYWLITWVLEQFGGKRPVGRQGGSGEYREAGAAPPPQDRAREAVQQYCRELEIDLPFTQAQLRDAYRRKMSEYHPDKVATLGKELQDLAETKSKAINVAYEQLSPLARG